MNTSNKYNDIISYHENKHLIKENIIDNKNL